VLRTPGAAVNAIVFQTIGWNVQPMV